jgi:hypothetical protein
LHLRESESFENGPDLCRVELPPSLELVPAIKHLGCLPRAGGRDPPEIQASKPAHVPQALSYRPISVWLLQDRFNGAESRWKELHEVIAGRRLGLRRLALLGHMKILFGSEHVAARQHGFDARYRVSRQPRTREALLQALDPLIPARGDSRLDANQLPAGAIDAQCLLQLTFDSDQYSVVVRSLCLVEQTMRQGLLERRTRRAQVMLERGGCVPMLSTPRVLERLRLGGWQAPRHLDQVMRAEEVPQRDAPLHRRRDVRRLAEQAQDAGFNTRGRPFWLQEISQWKIAQ